MNREGDPMVRLAVIADDLTGANDTAVQFAKRNISACVQIEFNENNAVKKASDVIVVDTDSRSASPEEAYKKVRTVSEIFRKNNVGQVYKKVDSTLRGNLGAEIMAADDVFCPQLVVIAPAFPSNRRTTVGGYHFLDGVPIELTEIAHAPKTPVNESQIIKLLKEQADRKMAEISLSCIRKGKDAIQEALQRELENGIRWVIFDAAEESHFDPIIEAATSFGKVLWVGSAGLADHLPSFWSWSEGSCAKAEPVNGPVCIIAGSVSHTTQQQIQTTLEKTAAVLVKLDTVELLRNRANELGRCSQQVNLQLADGMDVLLVSAVDDADVEKAVSEGRQQGLSDKAVSEETARALGEISRELSAGKMAVMVLTGGDTAIHVCKALRADSIEVLDEVAVGIPLGRLAGGDCPGMRVVTKAGAFGEADAFVKAMQFIRKPSGK